MNTGRAIDVLHEMREEERNINNELSERGLALHNAVCYMNHKLACERDEAAKLDSGVRPFTPLELHPPLGDNGGEPVSPIVTRHAEVLAGLDRIAGILDERLDHCVSSIASVSDGINKLERRGIHVGIGGIDSILFQLNEIVMGAAKYIGDQIPASNYSEIDRIADILEARKHKETTP
jgi:hypothetical protein